MQPSLLTKLVRASFGTVKQANMKVSFASKNGPEGWRSLARVAVFSAKKYDISHFDRENEKLEEKRRLYFDYHPEELNERTAKLVEGYDTVCAFVNDKLNTKCVTALKEQGVDLIALRCAGFNNVDLAKCQELGVKVVRVPAYSPYAVAEHTMALLLGLNRRIHKAYNRTKEGNFSLDGLLGFDLHGKTVGIFGAGKIGRCFASICKGIGMNIIYYDIQENQEMNEMGGKLVSKEEVFKRSDVISLHCPLTPETKYIINKDTLAMMKNNAIIVNTGRGALIHTKSVIQALKKKKIAGLAIDVYEQEENIFFKDVSAEILADDDLSRLLTFPNVIVTGHQAFFTEEALTNICTTTINNIIDIRTKGECPNIVLPPKK